jgi:hypothetical protein
MVARNIIFMITKKELSLKQRHDKVVTFIKKSSKNYRLFETFQRPVKKKFEDDVVLFENVSDKIFCKKLDLTPEAFQFIFFLEGCPKKLLLFILLEDFDESTCEYSWNATRIENFKEFCRLIDSSSNYTDKVIKNAHRTLVTQNVTMCLARQQYMLNPLLVSSRSRASKSELIGKYSTLLIDFGLDTIARYYPKYK